MLAYTSGSTRSTFAASSAMHLTSLLDLSAQLSETDSDDRILNVALLSVMGKLKIRRACAFVPDGKLLIAKHLKGVSILSVPRFDLTEPVFTSEDDPDTAVLASAGLHWCIPLQRQGDLIAVLCFGHSLDGIEQEPDVRTYMDLVRSITSTAVHNAQMVRSLIQAKKDLQARNLLVYTLFESARDFTGAMELNQMLRTLSYRLMGQLMISSFGLFLTESDHEEHVIINRQAAAGLQDLYPDILEVEHPFRTEDLSIEHPLRPLLERNGVAVVSPMTVHGHKKGVLALCGKLNGQRFSDDEVLFVEALGNTAMAAIENERLFREELDKQRLESELSIAADIQRGLLPVQLPPTPGIDIAADTYPSKHISGDYYDVIPLDDHRTLLAIADVAGKGVPAALLMANVQAALNVLAKLDLPLTQLVDRINRLVCDNTEPEVFVTMFLAIVDSRTMAVHYVNAGHNPPILLDGEDVVLLSDGGIITGVIADPPPYRMGIGTLRPDAVLVLYTDGVTEARNPDGHEYDVGSLVESARRHRAGTARELLDRLQDDLRQYTDSHVFDDDTSIVVVKPLG